MKQETIKKESYLVEGMTCSGCERTLQKVIGNLEGAKIAQSGFKVFHGFGRIRSFKSYDR